MQTRIQRVLSQNITLVYESLNLQAVDGSKLKRLMGAETAPLLMDTPAIMVAVYPPEPILIQIADRRIRITNQQQSEEAGKVPLWDIAVKCNQLVAEPRPELVAYGFNYDLGVGVEGGNADQAAIALFIADRDGVNGLLDGQLLSLVPRLRFRRGETRYDLVLDPMGPDRMKVNLNAHYESQRVVLPSAARLQASYMSEFEYLVEMLPRLFEAVD